MSIDGDKSDAVGTVEAMERRDAERYSMDLTENEDGKVTIKTKLAVLSLIFMYEAYLFTLLMSVPRSDIFLKSKLTRAGQPLSSHTSTQTSDPILETPG